MIRSTGSHAANGAPLAGGSSRKPGRAASRDGIGPAAGAAVGEWRPHRRLRLPRITIHIGDITTQEVDAIVNAANSSLLGGGGVDGAIHRRGGPAILDECRRLRASSLPDGLPAGRAVATTAGRLRARWVIHTVGPVYAASRDPASVLASCHTEALRLADELGAKTIAVPAISTGAYGYPVDAAARVAVAAVRSAATAVEEVRFVLFGEEAYDAFARARDAV